jgi:pyruvate formate lyase activating enzyme
MVLTTYGRSSGFCVDPIEKKPLNPFPARQRGALVRHRGMQPGVQVLPELGHLEVARHGPAHGPRDTGAIARAAVESGCRSVAFTYNDPVIFASTRWTPPTPATTRASSPWR